MTALAIFGFFVLAALALCVTVAAGVAMFGGVAFSGKVGPFGWIIAAVAVALWVLVWRASPFTVAIGG